MPLRGRRSARLRGGDLADAAASTQKGLLEPPVLRYSLGGSCSGYGPRRAVLPAPKQAVQRRLRTNSMPTKAVYFLAIPGFADWEAAHALAELRRHGHFRVEVVGLTRDAVQSMGGLTVQPTAALAELDPVDVAVFILPGGDRWEQQPVERELATVLKTLEARSVPIAAICAATTAVARVGIITGRRHTSNGLEYLKKHVPDYSGAAMYVDAPAVRDRGLITASGLADVEFANEIMAELGVLGDSDRSLWTSLFRRSE